jgi:hypothetical protein
MALAYLGYLQELRQPRLGVNMCLAYLGHAEEDSFDHEKSRLLPIWDMSRKTADSRRS